MQQFRTHSELLNNWTTIIQQHQYGLGYWFAALTWAFSELEPHMK